MKHLEDDADRSSNDYSMKLLLLIRHMKKPCKMNSLQKNNTDEQVLFLEERTVVLDI